MKKIVVSEPYIVYQGTDQPILKGGNQDPFIRCKDGVLYVRFNSRRDCPETFGMEDLNPIYCSRDLGETWEKSTYDAWNNAIEPLPNGDVLVLREHKIVKTTTLPPLPANREKTACGPSPSISMGATYTVEELEPIYGKDVAKVFKAERKKAGTDTFVEEECIIHWKNMPAQVFEGDLPHIRRTHASDKYKVDKNGHLWMTVHAGGVAEDGSLLSKRLCVHLLKSEDFGHNWHYVSTIPYKEEYHDDLYGVEGFDEATIEFTDDGMIVIMRSGSLFPGCWYSRPENSTIPKSYIAKSTDEGKTWDVKPFYDYGIRPQSVKLGCGSIVMTSGRPGVYVRATDDPKGENWGEVINLLEVPEENVEMEYYEYSCSNNDICAFDDKTAFVTYSNFRLNTPEGVRAKSILVSKITVE